jgi:hypothetical protein
VRELPLFHFQVATSFSAAIKGSSKMGRVDIHPAVFVRVAGKGLRGYGTWKSVEAIDSRILASSDL